MINLNNLYKFLLSRFIEKKEFKKSIWVQNYLKIRQNEYVNLYPNIASFAVDRIGANILVIILFIFHNFLKKFYHTNLIQGFLNF